MLCYLTFCLFLIKFIVTTNAQATKFLIIYQNGQENLLDFIEKITNNNFEATLINIKGIRNHNFCELYEKGYSIILDVTWNNLQLKQLMTYVKDLKMLVLKVNLSFGTIINIIESYLHYKNATSVLILSDSSENVSKILSYFFNSQLRVLVLNGMDPKSIYVINKSHYIPSSYVVLGNVTTILRNLEQTKIRKFSDKLIISAFETDLDEIKSNPIGKDATFITYNKKKCCLSTETCNCDTFQQFLRNSFHKLVLFLSQVVQDLQTDGLDIFSQSRNCSSPVVFPKNIFYEYVNISTQNVFNLNENSFRFQLNATFGTIDQETVAYYSNKLYINSQIKQKSMKKYFRVATKIKTPWAFYEWDSRTNSTHLTGFCMKLIHKLSEEMSFDYELISDEGNLGERQSDGSWNGLIEDLVNEEVDIVVAPIETTVEKEEIVDFTIPNFASESLSIVVRKPVKETSLFKFLNVFNHEIWIVILSSIILIGILLFGIEKLFKFDGTEIEEMEEHQKKIALSDTLWFSIMSFTSQGSSNVSKNVSAVILIAAYWIFIVLILATFTANLTAFLTVQRMNVHLRISDLEELAQMSRINFTVAQDSRAFEHFNIMNSSENEIFDMWGVLGRLRDTVMYRVWDYPVNEYYSNILKTIIEGHPVKTAEEGFQRVVNDLDGNTAFIHDTSEIRHVLENNCDLTEIGEPFAEVPYSAALPQASVYLEEVNRRIRIFNMNKNLNSGENTLNNINCPNEEEDGLNWTSLRGIFVVVLIVAVVILIVSIIQFLLLMRTKIYFENKETTAKKITVSIKPEFTVNAEFNPPENIYTLNKFEFLH